MVTIDSIKMCEVAWRDHDKYEIRCVISNFGKKLYTYIKGKNAIYYGSAGQNCLLLDGEAVKTVNDAVSAFDAEIESALSYHKIGEAFYINSDKAGRYNALIRGESDILIKGAALPDILKKVPEHYIPSFASLKSSGLYQLAEESGDRFLRSELEVMFGDISSSDLAFLTETTGEVWLPRLGEEQDKTYYVDSSEIDLDALKRSGFRVNHKPYFAMSGYKHEAYSINPHTKRVIDAVPRGSEAISYEEFLKLFKR